MKVLNMLIILLCKILKVVLKLLGKNAGTLPGRLALTLNKNIRDFISFDGKLIVITGTNGKTTTTNMIYDILKKSNETVVCNIGGNNIAWGITTTLINAADINGKIKAKYIVLETDEHFVPIIYNKTNLKIDSLILLNFFADQLDRTGEVDLIVQKIENFVKNSFDGNLILNGNDPNCVRIGECNKNGKNYYYGLGKVGSEKQIENKIICPICKEILNYEYNHYSWIGKFKCSACNFGDIKFACEVSKVKDNKFYIDKEEYITNNPNLYNIYNLTAIITLGSIYNLDKTILNDVFENYEAKDGRYQKFNINGKKITLNLGKNPAGFDVVLNNIKAKKEEKELLLIINDKVNDGKDVSWIWDINFKDMGSFDKIVCSGIRAYDVAIALKYNGYDIKKIVVNHDIKDAVNNLLETDNKKYIISNYSPLVNTINILKELGDK